MKKLLSVLLMITLLFGVFSVSASAALGDATFSEEESNNSIGLAQRINNSYTVSGSVSGYDRDFFEFVLTQSITIRVECVSDFNFLSCRILNASESCVATGTRGYTDDGLPSNTINKTLPAGTYYIVIDDENNWGIATHYMVYLKYSTSSSSTIHTHTYTNSCDTTCNGCGASREITHTFTNPCETTCDVCWFYRETTHTYTNACDTVCDVCGITRETTHTFTNPCDTTCDVCGVYRAAANHFYFSGTETCVYCGAKKTPPRGTKIKSVVAGAKKITVKWNKLTNEINGYQIQYSTSSKFKGNTTKTITIKSYKTSSKTIKKLKAKKKYYVRIRTYKTENSMKYYSNWSAKKSKKTK